MTTSLNKDIVPFLTELSENNNRDWFTEQKPRFEENVQGSMLAFLEALEPKLRKISEHILVVPKKSGGSLMRIYRDTRFGKDKSPYHTYVAAQLRHELGKKTSAPGYYLRVQSDGVLLGAGVWQPEGPNLKKIRDAIVEDSAAWKRARDNAKFKKLYGPLAGESLKRPPRGFDAEHLFVEDLKRKDFVAFRELSASAASRKDFLDKVVETYAAAKPLMKFLCEAMELEF